MREYVAATCMSIKELQLQATRRTTKQNVILKNINTMSAASLITCSCLVVLLTGMYRVSQN